MPVALEIFVKVLLLAEDCHWMLPALPLKVSTVLLVPVQTAPPPVTVPPVDAGLTVTVTTELVMDAQAPLLTMAL